LGRGGEGGQDEAWGDRPHSGQGVDSCHSSQGIGKEHTDVAFPWLKLYRLKSVLSEHLL